MSSEPAVSMAQSASDPSLQLARILRDFGPFVGRTLRYLGVPEQDLEDVCQEVFLIVHRKVGGFEGRSTLRTWLYGICVREARAHRRRLGRRDVPSGVALPADARARGPEAADDRRLLLELLGRLDDDKRTVVVLYEVEGLKMREVADVVGCPLQTAYSRLHAAREQLRTMAREMDMGRTG